MLEEIVARLSAYEVVLEPDQNTPEWWAGAPSVVKAADGVFYMAARMREGRSPRGMRGYEIRILKSLDGRRFETVNQIKREDAGLRGFERPALVIDPATGRFKLYGCTPLEDGWAILKFDDANSPQDFDARSARTIIAPENKAKLSGMLEGFKDPFVFLDKGRWHMFVVGYDRVERIHHFVSEDGESWGRVSQNPCMENVGWHNFYTRPACVMPMAVGYLLVYEGSQTGWYDPIYNIATGLAYSPDLGTFFDLTPDKPLLKSTTPGDYHTWRYSHWMQVGSQVFVYFEAARPNNTNEVRLGVFEAGFVA